MFQFAAGRRRHLQTAGVDGASRGCCPASVSIAGSGGPGVTHRLLPYWKLTESRQQAGLAVVRCGSVGWLVPAVGVAAAVERACCAVVRARGGGRRPDFWFVSFHTFLQCSSKYATSFFFSSEHTQAVCAVLHAAGDVSRLALHEACAVVPVVCDCGSGIQ